MTVFDSGKKQELIEKLKDSRQDFGFNTIGIKNRLISDMNEIQPTAVVRPRFFQRQSVRVATAAGIPIILLSATFAAAANSVPGDKLFGLNKLGENLVLSLPLSAEQKADIQTHIVTTRLQELTDVPKTKNETREVETIEASGESLKNAINMVATNRDQLRKNGQTQRVKKLNEDLNQLDNLAQEHMQAIQTIEASIPDQSVRATIDARLVEIKNARQKVRAELNLDDSQSN